MRPRLGAHVVARPVGDGDAVLVLSERRRDLLEDRALRAVLPFLDGTRTSTELWQEVADRFGFQAVLAGLIALRRIGALADGPAPSDGPVAGWWETAGIEPPEAATVAVAGVGGADPAPVVDALGAAGAAVADEADLLVVVAPDVLTPGVAEVARTARDRGATLLLARVAGTVVWLGPLLGPSGAPCWRCLARRVQGNRVVDGWLRASGDSGDRPPAPALESTLRTAAGLVATEALTIAATGTSPRTERTLVTFDLLTLETTRHAVVAQPDCPECGDPAAATRSERVTLEARPKRYRGGGGHRDRPPEATVARLMPHVSPITGLVRGLVDATPPGTEAHVWVSGQNFALMGNDARALRRGLRSLSGGKGRTAAEARAGALCEALERISGMWRGGPEDTRASAASLGEEARTPPELLLVSEAQFADREATNAEDPGVHRVPEPFDAEREIDWVRTWSLTHGCPRLLPASYAWFGHPESTDPGFCVGDSNGNAAGNTLEEAVLQGLMELVERDGAALWWYPRSRVPAIDLEASDDPCVARMRAFHAGLGRDTWALDTTTDLGVASVVAVSRRTGGDAERILLGFGTHLDPAVAVTRALTEINQALVPLLRDGEEDLGRLVVEDPGTVAWLTQGRVADHPQLVPEPGAPARRVADLPRLATDDFRDDVLACVRRIADAGHEVLVLDQTRPDVDLRVVKVIAPGLRHFWRRLAPGRLYDVPPRLGWVDTVPAEAELDPRPLPG